MPKELDERFGPTPQSFVSKTRLDRARRPNFRFRIVPALLLFCLGVGGTLLGIAAFVDQLMFVWRHQTALMNQPDFVSIAIRYSIYAMTVLAWGPTVLAASLYCLRGRWRLFSILVMAAIVLGTIAFCLA